ncbi:hypothetical protein KCU67_g7197, partial [Aureobasidium melanogenum]
MVSSIEKYMAVVDAAVQYDPVHSALPWAGIRFFLQLSINDSNTFDAIIEGLEILSRVVARYSIFEVLYLGSTTPAQVQLKDDLIRLYATVHSYLCKARKYYNRSITKRIVVNTSRPPELDKALTVVFEEEASVRRQADLIDTERQTEGLLLVKDVGVTAKQVELRIEDLLNSQQKLEAQLKKLEAPFVRTFDKIRLLQNSLERAERIELLLSKVPYRELHRIISWMTSSASEIFWQHGTSGSGKTKLVAIFLENLEKTTRSLANAAPFAYFYCSRALAEPERADPCEILRSIIKQLSQSQSGILQPTVDSFEQKRLEAESDGLPPSTLMLSECTDLLLQLVNATPVTILIDALEVDKGMETLRLTHPSVREYLETLPQFSKNEMSSVIAERCLAANINHRGTRLDKLANYAIIYWALHCENATGAPRLSGSLSEFLFDRDHFSDWVDILDTKLTDVDINSDLAKKLHAIQSNPPSPLFVLSCFGLFRLLDDTRLETSISNWHQCNLSGASALYIAARWEHLDAVKYLVRLGLNVNNIGGLGHALQASAFAGHHQIAAFLMDNGATMSGPGETFDEVYAAISSGNAEIASMILEKGYKSSFQQKFEECLNLAAFEGHADLMLSMLQGINFEFSPKQTHDVLQVALYGRNERKANLWIDGYGDINVQTRYFENALHAAICGGSFSLVKRVHAEGVDLRARGRFWYALRAAVALGH